jgi:hypothetical protein
VTVQLVVAGGCGVSEGAGTGGGNRWPGAATGGAESTVMEVDVPTDEVSEVFSVLAVHASTAHSMTTERRLEVSIVLQG